MKAELGTVPTKNAPPAGRANNAEEILACANCAKEYTSDQLNPCKDFWLRVEPGETIPHGDCPDCGAFCYPKETNDFQV